MPNPSTHIWTDNAALCIADFLTNTEFGVGCTWDEIDIDQLIVAANICDEQVPLAAAGTGLGSWQANHTYNYGDQIVDSHNNVQIVMGFTTLLGLNVPVSGNSQPSWKTNLNELTYDGWIIWQNKGARVSGSLTESRYTINGFFLTTTTPGDTLDSMLMSCEGRITWSGGKWAIFPAAWYGSSPVAFDQNDLAGPVKWTAKRKFRDLNNAVRATYICPVYPYAVTNSDKNIKQGSVWSGQFQPADAPEYAQDPGHGYPSDVNLAADAGIKLYADRRYQFVQSVATVQRLMKIYLLRNRQQGSGTLRMKLSAYQTKAQDIIQMTFPVLGWDSKYLEVQNFRFFPMTESEGEAPSVYCEVDVAETDPSVYTWSTAEERGVEDTPSPTLYRASIVGTPSNLQLASGDTTALIGADGVVLPRIKATWNQPDDTFTTTGGHIQVQIQSVGDGVENLVVSPEDFTDSINWQIASTTTVTANTVAGPDNNTTADTINFAAKTANTTDGLYQTTPIVAQNQDVVFSVWLKADSTQPVEIVIEDYPTWTTGASNVVTVNSTWQRYEVHANLNTANPLQVWIRSPWGSALGAYSVYAWGAQFEHGTTANGYTSIPEGNWKTAAILAGTAVQAHITGVVTGQTYNVQIRAVRSNGKYSDWVQSLGHVVGSPATNLQIGSANLIDNSGFESGLI